MINVCIDTETSHLRSDLGVILQLTMMAYDDKFNVISKLDTYIQPYESHLALIKMAMETDEHLLSKDLKGMKKAMKVNQITLEKLNRAPSPLEARNMFMGWWAESLYGQKIYPLGQNYDKFDLRFLEKFLGVDFMQDNFHYKSRDTSKLLIGMLDAGLFPDLESTGLVKACRYFDIPHLAHDSYGDVFATIKLWERLVNELNKGVNTL